MQTAALLLASIAVALLLGEWLVRLVAPQQLILKRPDIWQPVEGLGWNHRPRVRTRVNTGERTVGFYTDAEGFRVSAAGRKDADRRVLLLGDSFLAAMQVEHEESMAGLLEVALEKAVGEPVAIRNTGVGGWDPPHYAMQARSALQREDFDLVVTFLYLGNDIVSQRVDRYSPRPPKVVHPLRLPRSLQFTEIVQSVLYPINDVLEVRSHLFVLFKSQAETALMRLGLTAAYFPAALLRSELRSPRWSVTAAICAEIDSIAAAAGSPTLFVFLPTPTQVERETLRRHLVGMNIDMGDVDLEQPNRMLGRELRSHGLAHLDLLSAFREAHSRGMRLYGDVDRHFSPEGHRVAVREISAPMVERLKAGDHLLPPRTDARRENLNDG